MSVEWNSSSVFLNHSNQWTVVTGKYRSICNIAGSKYVNQKMNSAVSNRGSYVIIGNLCNAVTHSNIAVQISQMCAGVHVKGILFLFIFDQTSILLTDYSNVSHFCKNPFVGSWIIPCRQMDKHEASNVLQIGTFG